MNKVISILLIINTSINTTNFNSLAEEKAQIISNSMFDLKSLREYVSDKYHTNESLSRYRNSEFLVENNTQIEILLRNEQFVFVPAQPSEGFNVPYVLKFPSGRFKNFNKNNKKYLFLAENGTAISKYYDNNITDFIWKNITDDRATYNTTFSKVADQLDLPILSPRFSWQCAGTETDQALNLLLDRDSVLANNKNKSDYKIKRCLTDDLLNLPLKDSDFDSIIDVELQTYNIINHSKELLRKFNYPIEEKILTMGYSSTGVFAQRFATIYPELIKAFYAGGFLFPIIPANKYDNVDLPFPFGTSEHKEFFNVDFNLEEYNKIAKINAIGRKEYSFSGLDRHSRQYAERFFGAPSEWIDDKKSKIIPNIWNKYVDIFYDVGGQGMHLMNTYSAHYISDNDLELIIDFFRMNLNSEHAVYPTYSKHKEHVIRFE